MLEFRAKLYADEVKQENLRVVRGKVELAWQAKDYAQVIELYGPVRNELTNVEAKKLVYAESRCALDSNHAELFRGYRDL